MTNEHKQVLIKILQEQFTEGELKAICLKNESQFDGNPYDKIEGDTPEQRSIYLIDYLIRYCHINRFLNILKNKNSKFAFLEGFLNKLFAQYNFHTLIDIFKQLEDKDKGEILSIYISYTTSRRTSFYQKLQSFDEERIIHHLLSSIESSQNENSLLSNDDNDSLYLLALNDFADYFLKELLHIQKIKEKLTEWIQNNCPGVKISDGIINKVNNIVTYLFFIIEPQPGNTKEFLIKAQLAQFRNNKTQEKIQEFTIELKNELKEFESCMENQIPNYIDEIIKEMYEHLKLSGLELSELPIIELFLPIQLLSTDFDIKEITDEWGNKTAIGKLYPLTVRSYERFFKQNRLKLIWKKEWERLEILINEVSTFEDFVRKIESEDSRGSKDIPPVKLIDCPFPTPKKRVKFFQKILSEGFPLCLWTRYTINDDDNSKKEKLKSILDIDFNDSKSIDKLYKIYDNIYDIRRNNMSDKNDFGYKLGVLFDHDKIPTKSSQLISPNMAMKVK